MIPCRSSSKRFTYYFPSEPGTAFDVSGLYSPSQPAHFPIPDDGLEVEGKEEIVKENYIKLQNKRKEALDSLKETVAIIVSRENIVRHLLSMYKDPSILQMKFSAVIEGSEATGDGVLREVYSSFWDTFLSESDGDGEHTSYSSKSKPGRLHKHRENFDAPVSTMRCLSSQIVTGIIATCRSSYCHGPVHCRVISCAPTA